MLLKLLFNMWILLQQIEKLSTTTIPLKGIEQWSLGVNLIRCFTLFFNLFICLICFGHSNHATHYSYYYWCSHQFLSWYVYSFNYCSTKKSRWRQTPAGMWGWHFGMWTILNIYRCYSNCMETELCSVNICCGT